MSNVVLLLWITRNPAHYMSQFEDKWHVFWILNDNLKMLSNLGFLLLISVFSCWFILTVYGLVSTMLYCIHLVTVFIVCHCIWIWNLLNKDCFDRFFFFTTWFEQSFIFTIIAFWVCMYTSVVGLKWWEIVKYNHNSATCAWI